MAFDPEKPYDRLPALPPSQNLDTVPVWKAVTGARVAICRLREAAKKLPDQAVLIQTLGLREARFSSEIENIVTTGEEVFDRPAVAHDDFAVKPAVKEVYLYQDALWHGYNAMMRRSRKIDADLMTGLYRIIKQASDGVRARPGTYVGNAYKVIYTPPSGADVILKKLGNLSEFVDAGKGSVAAAMDPLVRMAVAHYQFEAIHPFHDGNGRVGRVISVLQLIHDDLLDVPILYLSKYILETKNEYYDRLLRVTRDGDWEGWVLYMLRGVESTANETSEVIDAIGLAMRLFSEKLKRDLPGFYSRELVESCFKRGYIKATDLEADKICGKTTAYTYLNAMVEAGLLETAKRGRTTYYVNRRMLLEIE